MPRGAGAAKEGAKKGPKAHKLAEEFPKGLTLTDVSKKEWQLGDVIGQGGFGLIYLASRGDSKAVTKENIENVVKIEPHANGPLRCEVNFYLRAAKQENITQFITKHKLHYLAVPPYISFGIHDYKAKQYRFLVMPRFGTDLQQHLNKNGGTLPPQAVFAVGLRMVDALEFIHEQHFVHADIKAGNILLGYKNGKEQIDQVYLVDFGLATKYMDDTKHKEYKEDPRKAHDGTIEFTSRDAHKGLNPARRGDIEILGYCLLQWLSGHLPWMSTLADPNAVAASKEKFMQTVPALVKSCFLGASSVAAAHSSSVQSFLEEVNKIKYDQRPNYTKLRTILKAGLAQTGQKNEWSINLAAKKSSSKTPTKRKSGAAGDSASPSPVKKPRASSPKKKPATATDGKIKPPKPSTPKVKTASSSRSPPKVSKSPMKSPLAKKSPKSISLPPPSKPKRSTALSPKLKANGRSPAASKSKSTSKMNGDHKKKELQLPVPTKPAAKSPKGAAKTNPTRRVVRRVTKAKSDSAVQTSPLQR